MYIKMAEYFLGDDKTWDVKEEDFIYTTERISTCKDFLRTSKDGNKGMEPGYNMTIDNDFKITNEDLIVDNLKQHKSRSKIDYSRSLLTLRPEQALKLRYESYLKKMSRPTNKT